MFFYKFFLTDFPLVKQNDILEVYSDFAEEENLMNFLYYFKII